MRLQQRLDLLSAGHGSDSGGALEGSCPEHLASLGWLIDPVNREVFVYRPELNVERLDAPVSLSGHPVMTGFELRMDDVW